MALVFSTLPVQATGCINFMVYYVTIVVLLVAEFSLDFDKLRYYVKVQEYLTLQLIHFSLIITH